MRPNIFDIFRCPECDDSNLQLNPVKFKGDQIDTGKITCDNCGQTYPIIRGIPCLLKREQMEVMESHVMQQWLKEKRNIDKDIVDEDQKTYREICRKATSHERISDDATRLLWEKKLFMDSQLLKREMGDETSSKWAVAEKNLHRRNDHIIRFIDESETSFAGKLILNIGPGMDDDLIKRLESMGTDIINCDIILDPLIRLASDNERQCMCSDLKFLALRDSTFDAVLCFHVIHHVHPIDKALSESIRVLKAGGKIFITEVNHNNIMSLQGRLLSRRLKRLLREFVRKYTGTSERIYKSSPYEKVIPTNIIIETMRKVGFKGVVRQTAVHSPQCYPDIIIDFWDKLGFKFPTIFDPVAFEYFLSGIK